MKMYTLYLNAHSSKIFGTSIFLCGRYIHDYQIEIQIMNEKTNFPNCEKNIIMNHKIHYQ